MKNIKDFTTGLRTLNPKEVHNWPMPVNLFIGTILFFVLVSAGVGLHLLEKYDSLDAATAKEEKLKKDFVEKKTQAINLDLYKKQLVEVTITSDTLLKQLPNKSEMDRLLIDINQAALGRGLQIELFKPGQEKMYEFYADLPISIKVNGTYKAIGEFASDVSQLSRVVLLNNLELNKKDKETVVTMDVTAKTFRYLDQEELIKQKAEKDKAKREAKAKAAGANEVKAK